MPIARPLIALCAGLVCAASASAQISDDVIRIGLVTDLSGVYRDDDGTARIEAIRMAMAGVAADKTRPYVVVGAGTAARTNEHGLPCAMHDADDTGAMAGDRSAATPYRKAKLSGTFVKSGWLRADGFMVHDMPLLQVKRPAKSKDA
jgi:xanthine dehydrogenase iron-sulfur cluster and FAD-binding subunit A